MWMEKITGCTVYPDSVQSCGDAEVAMARDEREKFLLAAAAAEAGLPPDFEGELQAMDGFVCRRCPLSAANAAALRRHFPWTAPRSLRAAAATVGFGDRLGAATAGQLRAIKKYRCAPVLAQQSMRELTMTNRTYRAVVDDVVFQVFQMNYRDGYGADGDHLKNIADIDTALAAGMPMITLDLSEVMNFAAGDWSNPEIDAAYAKLDPALRARLEAAYADRTFAFGEFVLALDAATLRRCAVMYLAAIDFAAEVHAHLAAARGADFDLEISIDETSTPTLPEHHLFFANELTARNISFVSLAPRFIGEFQKGIDYKGDLAEFERQFKVHAAIAAGFGCYKISVHSGSDKFKVFPIVGRETGGRFHLKTAGTSWLEAVRVMAKCEPALYRKMHAKALDSFADMLKLYHVTIDFSRIPSPDTLKDGELPQLLDNPDARQLLHITYGPILNDPALRAPFFAALYRHEAEYEALLEAHFDRHLSLLGLPRR